jgi:hypothetical protein
MIGLDNTSKVRQASVGNWKADDLNLTDRLCAAPAIDHGGRIPGVDRGPEAGTIRNPRSPRPGRRELDLVGDDR